MLSPSRLLIGDRSPGEIISLRLLVMAYVTEIVMQFTSGSNEVSIKARGRAISAAVDVVEVCRRRFFEGKLHVRDITIGTEQLGIRRVRKRLQFSSQLNIRLRSVRFKQSQVVTGWLGGRSH
jgi:DNA-binding protein Alba